jgi:glutaconate CoA-transferase, subunit A
MPPDPIFPVYVELDELVARIPDGAMLAVPKDDSGVAIEATRAMIRRGISGLHLVCLPVSGFQADLLIGAGCVSTIECSGVALGEAGMAPRFRDAVQNGKLRILDATCPAIYAAIQAGEKGLPFLAVRGLIGSDILANRDDWKVIQNPVTTQDDPIVIVPAIRPDFALFHARLGDRLGNVWVGNRRECAQLAHAARGALVTVEEIHDGNLMEDERYIAGTIPPLYLDAVAHVPRGAWPVGLTGRYERDIDHLRSYARAAKTDDGFRDYLARNVLAETVPA